MSYKLGDLFIFTLFHIVCTLYDGLPKIETKTKQKWKRKKNHKKCIVEVYSNFVCTGIQWWYILCKAEPNNQCLALYKIYSF